MKRIHPFITLLILILFVPHSGKGQSAQEFRLRKVVIDAGHGGNAPGAVWGKLQEKAITLSVALKLGNLIRKRFPDVEVIYTRTADVAVDLSKRSDIANKAKADLFISIHVNSAESTAARGTETWVMGMDKAQKNLDVAIRENSVISYEKDYRSKYEGFDPTSVESYIIFSLMQYAYLEQSLAWASLIQKEFAADMPTPDRGVKQGPLLVLWKATMPSLLTEIGFISNEQDRKFLSSEEGQNKIASSLLNAFAAYKKQYEAGNTGLITPSAAVSESTKPSVAPAGTGKREEKSAQPSASPDSGKRKFSSLSGANISDEKELPERPGLAVQPQKSGQTATGQSSSVIFRVQVRSAARKVSVNAVNFGRYRTQVVEKIIDNRYKYFIGEKKTYKEALSLQKELKRDGFVDSFIAAFRNGKPIDIRQAIELSE